MPSNLDPIFDAAAKKHGIDPSLLRAVAQTESSGDPNAVSKDDQGNPTAYGLMQFTPETAKSIGLADPMNPSQAIPAAAQLLRQNIDASGGDEKAALMMYHGGTDQRNWGVKTQAYPAMVANNQAKIVQQQVVDNDPIYKFFNGGESTTSKQGSGGDGQSTSANSSDPVYDFFASGGSAPHGPKVDMTPMTQDEIDEFHGTPHAQAEIYGVNSKGPVSGATSADIPATKGIYPVSAADVQRGKELAQPDRTWKDDNFLGNAFGPIDAGVTVASTMGVGATAPAAGFVQSLFNGKDPEQNASDIAEKMQYIPRTGTGAQLAGIAGRVLAPLGTLPTAHLGDLAGALKAPTSLAKSLASEQLEKSFSNKLVASAARVEPSLAGGSSPLSGGAQVPAYMRTLQQDFERAKLEGRPIGGATVQSTTPSANVTATSPSDSGLQSVGAAATKQSNIAAASGATPAIQEIISGAEAANDINANAATRHIEASSLPTPVELTVGQATGDVHQLSKEQNQRGKQPEYAERFNKQNVQLAQNLDMIRDAAAPDVYAVNHVESGQSLIDSYKTKDAALSGDISAKYKALEDANGGQFPVNGKEFVAAADAALAKKMKGRYVPPEVQADMDEIRNGGPMTYENFENMRTNLAAEARKAERAGDGNRAMATGIVRNALESLPMTGESAAIKPIADAARNAAKARFDLIDNDPAYKAAINDTTPADSFINKFVVKGNVGDVKAMRANLAHDDLAGQTIASGALNYLKDRAMGSSNKFSQTSYNNGLKAIGPKLGDLVPQEQAQHLQTLGNVARYTQEQPVGSYVNNSNTLVANAANVLKSTAEGVANVAAHGLPIGTWVRKGLEKHSAAKAVEKALQPGAGIRLSDFPK